MELDTSRLDTRQIDQGIVLTPRDHRIADAWEAVELKAEIFTAIEQARPANVIIDFAHVQFVTASICPLLLDIQRKAHELGSQLKLTNLSPGVHNILELTELANIFDISPADSYTADSAGS